jgi:hypothetical protein
MLARTVRIMKFTRIALLVSVVSLFAAGCSSEGNVFALGVGDCFGGQAGGEISDVPIVECSEPHESEVYSVWDVEGESLPIGTSSFEEGCLERFEAAIGAPFESSVVYSSIIFPTSDSWDQGDREVICYGFEVDEEFNPIKVTGSILDSGR